MGFARRLRTLCTTCLLTVTLGACGGDEGTETSADRGASPSAPPAPAPSAPGATASAQPATCTNVLAGVVRISVPTTLENGPSDCDYLVRGVIAVDASLTIPAGTTIRFAQDAGGITVDRDAFLIAVGRPDARIRLLGDRDVPGYWNGVRFAGGRTTNRLEYVDIENAGQAAGPAAFLAAVSGAGPISLKHSRIAKSFADGANLSSMTIAAFEDNVFEGNRFVGLVAARTQVPQLDLQSDYGGRKLPNGEPYIRLPYASQDQPATWKDLGTPYLIDIGVLLRAALTLEPGTKIVMDEGDELKVVQGGSLTAVGTAERPVVFTSKVQRPGAWAGLDFDSSRSPANRLQHVRVEYTGTASSVRDPVAIQARGLQGSTVALESVTFASVAGSAVCQRAESTVTLGPGLVYASAEGSRPVTAPLPQCRFY